MLLQRRQRPLLEPLTTGRRLLLQRRLPEAWLLFEARWMQQLLVLLPLLLLLLALLLLLLLQMLLLLVAP